MNAADTTAASLATTREPRTRNRVIVRERRAACLRLDPHGGTANSPNEMLVWCGLRVSAATKATYGVAKGMTVS
jgi:hypothetical protein